MINGKIYLHKGFSHMAFLDTITLKSIRFTKTGICFRNLLLKLKFNCIKMQRTKFKKKLYSQLISILSLEPYNKTVYTHKTCVLYKLLIYIFCQIFTNISWWKFQD